MKKPLGNRSVNKSRGGEKGERLRGKWNEKWEKCSSEGDKNWAAVNEQLEELLKGAQKTFHSPVSHSDAWQGCCSNALLFVLQT